MFTGTLYPYQADAVTDMIDRQSLLVAYSMGTGKTVLTIAATEELFGTGRISTCLILVPASLKWQWAQSLAAFTDTETRTVTLRGMDLTVPVPEMCTVINGTPKKRAEQWAYVADGAVDYVVASYGSVLHDWDQLVKAPVDCMVLDEATAIKNFAAQTTKRVKKLRPGRRLALTGTPVENRPEEIFSIMEWVDPRVLGRWDLFEKSFIVRNVWGAVQNYRNLDLLHRNLQKAMIRKSRLDPEVAAYLPAVAETTRSITLDKTTRTVYKRIMSDLAQALEELAESGSDFDLSAYYAGVMPEADLRAQGQVMARVLAARMLACHPELLMDSAEAYYDGDGEGSRYIADLVAGITHIDELLRHTPKLDELDTVIGEMLAEPGTKAAVFTCYRRMLPYLAGRLNKYGPMVQFHGGMSADQKAAAKARFDTDPDCRIFLSTNAGGYGLDLPAAQYLVNYDLPDSKGVLDQRNTRHVRASSTYSHVYVVNLICEDTIEERQMATLALRGKLSSAIVDGRGEAHLANSVETLTEHLSRLG